MAETKEQGPTKDQGQTEAARLFEEFKAAWKTERSALENAIAKLNRRVAALENPRLRAVQGGR